MDYGKWSNEFAVRVILELPVFDDLFDLNLDSDGEKYGIPSFEFGFERNGANPSVDEAIKKRFKGIEGAPQSLKEIVEWGSSNLKPFKWSMLQQWNVKIKNPGSQLLHGTVVSLHLEIKNQHKVSIWDTEDHFMASKTYSTVDGKIIPDFHLMPIDFDAIPIDFSDAPEGFWEESDFQDACETFLIHPKCVFPGTWLGDKFEDTLREIAEMKEPDLDDSDELHEDPMFELMGDMDAKDIDKLQLSKSVPPGYILRTTYDERLAFTKQNPEHLQSADRWNSRMKVLRKMNASLLAVIFRPFGISLAPEIFELIASYLIPTFTKQVAK